MGWSHQERFFLWTQDMEAAVQHVEELQVQALWEVQDIGSLCFVTFQDPDGNLLMVAQPNE